MDLRDVSEQTECTGVKVVNMSACGWDTNQSAALSGNVLSFTVIGTALIQPN